MSLLFSIRAENQATVARPLCSYPLNRHSWVPQVIPALSGDSPGLKTKSVPKQDHPFQEPGTGHLARQALCSNSPARLAPPISVASASSASWATVLGGMWVQAIKENSETSTT